MRPVGGLAVVVVLVVAACGGGDSESGDTTAPVSTTASTTAVTEPPATTERAATTTTRPAPTTTVDETAALIADIEADLNAGEQVFLEGAGTPASEESRANLERYFSDGALANLLEFYDFLVVEGLVARPNPDVPSELVVRTVVDRPSESSAVVEFCRIDAGVVVDPRPTGEVIFNDEITRYEHRVSLRLVEGVWSSPGGGETLAEAQGDTSCG